MIFLNKKMKMYVGKNKNKDIGKLNNFSIVKLESGFFFERAITDVVKMLASSYSLDKDSDWAGFEYSRNKIHLEDDVHGSIAEIASQGVFLIEQLAAQFKKQFPENRAVFWLGCDEFGEYPSVTLGFYVKRENMIPLLPEDDLLLDDFSNAILLVT